MKSDHELHLTSQEASDRKLMLLQLAADPWEALRSYCHEGVRVIALSRVTNAEPYWEVSICSDSGFGKTIHEALNNLRTLVIAKLEAGALGC